MALIFLVSKTASEIKYLPAIAKKNGTANLARDATTEPASPGNLQWIVTTMLQAISLTILMKLFSFLFVSINLSMFIKLLYFFFKYFQIIPLWLGLLRVIYAKNDPLTPSPGVILVEVDATLFYDDWSVDSSGIDVQDILTNKSSERQLYSANQEHTDDHWCVTSVEAVPVSKL